MFVLAYDLGGTKVEVGIVSSTGKILAHQRVPVVSHLGKSAVIQQLVELGQNLISSVPKKCLISRVGIASAGPLHPARGILLDPTNLSGGKKGWDRVPIVSLLKRELKLPVTLENDAAAAVLAEHWLGAAKNVSNAMILTLGTGLGTGIIANGKLVRAGRGLHTEAGHLILNENDSTAPCGCGNFGCAEAYLSGRNFALRFSKKYAGQFHKSNWSAEEIAISARKKTKGDSAAQDRLAALRAFDEYATHMATLIHNAIVIYAPEVIILTGSFANTSDLFLEKTKSNIKKLLTRRRKGIDLLPRLVVSKLKNHAGILGGAYVAIHAGKQN